MRRRVSTYHAAAHDSMQWHAVAARLSIAAHQRACPSLPISERERNRDRVRERTFLDLDRVRERTFLDLEFCERHVFQSHAKAWGQVHTSPWIRFVSEDDTIEYPDHQGFWTDIYTWIYIHIFICHAGANQHLLLRERPPLQLAPVLG